MSENKKQLLRDKIDTLDDMVAKALNDRIECAIEIGHIKRKSGDKLFDPKREEQIFHRLTTNNTGPLTAEALVRIFERIIDESRSIERTTAYDE
ncbi:chorismate mutase [Gemmatimonas aurantiaca]|nr:chorismate mutase [Gemmatimonas aurantiaca]